VLVAVEEPLAAGKYTVSWKTASSDMHPVTGDFSFTVK
jgi:methionine-rich copper-binding protein CopC